MENNIVCQHCGSANNYRIMNHVIVCNNCDRFMDSDIDFCPKCGEVGSIKTEEYGCFHTITRCSNCNYSIITNINLSLSDVQPIQSKIMNQQTWSAPAQPAPAPQQQQKTLAPIRLFPAHPNAPDFVLASGVIGLDEFFQFVQANPHLLSEYQGKAQLKFQILRSKEGKLYTQVDEYKPVASATPQQWGGHSTSPVYQPAPAPATAPAQWGAPQQSAGPTAKPYEGQLPF